MAASSAQPSRSAGTPIKSPNAPNSSGSFQLANQESSCPATSQATISTTRLKSEKTDARNAYWRAGADRLTINAFTLLDLPTTA